MNGIMVLFYDPNYGLAIEDALEKSGVSYSMLKTPEMLFEVDPLFCKTMIEADTNKETLKGLKDSRQLNIAGAFVKFNDRYESITLEAI
ncbi:hypothetical protein EHV15_34265 [Paenibacillus oralis]|uniref:Uncharacterized protein n=1 Tax=Paenibacillus oralis TaxID=2490856 RepID=A0A3P3TAU8_9BACL|nr:hypothetical protein [Paenibacillus oralis]RRJ54664.1 hypothetical protein EHV15_34265 [Paenibacillus oralis]